MGRIRRLDETLANQIAAGEVVERPASAAKELIENALDAGATRITCDIASGGVERLRIVDDGHGMSREDAELALQRHATSKIKSVSDLHHIQTLGFRGEALPSIASVSRLTLRTREPEALGAVRIRVEGGTVLDVVEVGGPPGTELVIEDLFFNVPARRKFLRKEATEAGQILEIVQRFALCYPQVAFRFIKDGRTTLDLPPGQTLLARARAVFGERATEGLAPVRFDLGGGFSVDGLMGPPELARSTPRHYHTFINGRYVRDRVVMAATQSAYGQRLERGRHPFVILRLTVPPETVDVNVHPAKTEVRFVDSGIIHRLIARAIDAGFAAEPLGDGADPAPAEGRSYRLTPPEPAPGGGPPAVPAPDPEAAGLEAHRRRVFDAMERLGAKRRGLGHPAPLPVHARAPSPVGSAQPPAPLRASPDAAEPPPARAAPPAPALALALPPTEPPPPARTGLAHARRLADLDLGRLVFTGLIGAAWAAYRAVDGVALVDARAARTRLAYERLRDGAPGRALSPPQPVELTPAEARRLPELDLAPLGLEIADFGGGSFAVTRLPAGLPPEAAALAARAVLAAPPPPEHLALALAELVAARAGAPAPAEAAGWPKAVAATRHALPRPVPWLVALTDSELERRRTEDALR